MSNVNNKISKLFKENPQLVNMILSHGNRMRNMAAKHQTFKKNLSNHINYTKFQRVHNNVSSNKTLPEHQRKEINNHRKILFNKHIKNASSNELRNMIRHYTYTYTKNELEAAKRELQKRKPPSKISRFFGMFRRKNTSTVN
jgi:exonuclease VII large subunit